MHVFITGERGVGKTTLIHKLVQKLPKEKCYGFYTEKVSPDGKWGEVGEIEMFSARETNGERHCLAKLYGKGKHDIYSEVFENYGVSLLEDIPNGSFVIMDELGFLESQSPQFCQKVLEVLDQDVKVFGVIKPKSLPFLDAIRNHPNVKVYTLTEENCDALTKELLDEG